MANEGAKFLNYGRHTKSQGKPATYREHIKAKHEALQKKVIPKHYQGNTNSEGGIPFGKKPR